MDMKKFADQTGTLREFRGVLAAAVVCGIALIAHAQTTSHADPARHAAATPPAPADASRCADDVGRMDNGDSQRRRAADPDGADCR